MDWRRWRCFHGQRQPGARAGHRPPPEGAAGPRLVGRFSDGEVNVEIMENVRGRDVFIVQPTCPPVERPPDGTAGDGRRLPARLGARITAVVPYFGYARQDRRPRATRSPITAKLVANMIDRRRRRPRAHVDLHADQIQGFFDIPVDNVYGSPVLLGDVPGSSATRT
jgi:ribose-phosphate pyrophosphokinase